MDIYLSVLETEKQKIKMSENLVSGEDLRPSLFAVSSYDGRGQGNFQVYFVRVLTLFMNHHPHDHIMSQGPHLLIPLL